MYMRGCARTAERAKEFMKGNSCTFTSVFYGIFQGKCHVPSVGGNWMVESRKERLMTTSGCDFGGMWVKYEIENELRGRTAANRAEQCIIINIVLMLASE